MYEFDVSLCSAGIPRHPKISQYNATGSLKCRISNWVFYVQYGGFTVRYNSTTVQMSEHIL
jgi:hypothetical protein